MLGEENRNENKTVRAPGFMELTFSVAGYKITMLLHYMLNLCLDSQEQVYFTITLYLGLI